MDIQIKRRKKYCIKSKFRFISFVAIMLISIVFLTGTILGLNDAASLSEAKNIRIEIQAGDTLWEIASAYGPQDKDRRQVIYEICRMNDITAESLQPGQSILVPTEI